MYLELPTDGLKLLPPGRNNALVITHVTQRGTGSVALNPHVQVTAETKRGYRRLMAYFTYASKRSEFCLATAGNRNFATVKERLQSLAAEVIRFTKHDHDYRRHGAIALADSFPIEQWLWVMMRGYEGGEDYFDSPDRETDDGRACLLMPMEDGKPQRLEIWPALRVIFEDKGRFRRLSICHYKSKGSSNTWVLSTSDKPDMQQAKAVLGTTIDEYRSNGRNIPDSLVKRLPLEQWFSMLLMGQESTKGLTQNESPESLLTTQPTKGKTPANCLARWTLSPSVVLAFQERVDRPALFLHQRVSSGSSKITHERIGSVPIVDYYEVRDIVRDAIVRNLCDRSFDRGGLGKPLLEHEHYLKGEGSIYKSVDNALDEIGFEGMLSFYDDAVLPLRQNGHKQAIYPDFDYSMRWISKACPKTRTASEDCWWVLVGTSRNGTGAVFPFNGDRDAALVAAKTWRDNTERELGIKP